MTALPPRPQMSPEQERAASMSNTVAAFGALWCSQGALNLPVLAKWPTVAKLGDAFKGQPAVIIAPGPSLSQNLHLVKQLKGRAVLIAFSRCLEILKPAGIVPDFVVVLDPLDLTYHFDGYDAREIECLCVGMTCNPKLYRLPVKRFASFSGNAVIEAWLYDHLDGPDTWLDTSCSVATTSTSLALKLGCDPIIYVGQDLSFPKGKYYDKGSRDGGATLQKIEPLSAEDQAEEDRILKTLGALAQCGDQAAQMAIQRIYSERDVRENGSDVAGFSAEAKEVEATGKAVLSRIGRVAKVPGYYGGKVPCTPSFSWVGEWLEKRAQLQPFGRMINATEGGRYIQGMVHAPLQTVIDGGEVKRGSEVHATLDPLPDTPVDVPGVLDGICEALDTDKQRADLLAMSHDIRDSMTTAGAAAFHLDNAIDRRYPARTLRGLESWMVDAIAPASMWASVCMQAHTATLTQQMNATGGDDAWRTALADLCRAVDTTRKIAQACFDVAIGEMEGEG
mgnify:CR=1 FL=1